MEKRKVTRYIYNDVRFVIDSEGEIYFCEYDIRKIVGYGNGPLFSKTKSGKKIKIQFEEKEHNSVFYTIKSIREFLKNHNTYKTDKITRLNSLYGKLYNDVVFRNKKDEWLCIDTDDGRAPERGVTVATKPVHDEVAKPIVLREPNDVEDIKKTLAKINVSLAQLSTSTTEVGAKLNHVRMVEHTADEVEKKWYEDESAIIKEMVMTFGFKRTAEYCQMNVWKYRSRFSMNENSNDKDKANWYMNRIKELRKGGKHDGQRSNH
jgi:hypothetical protein